MDRRWVIAPAELPDVIETLARELSLPVLMARLLAQRGLRTPAEAHSFLRPALDDLHDPFLMKDLRAAAERLDQAIAMGERIFVFGDYDVDGLTSAAMLTEVLSSLGGRVTPRIPERLREGYGLSLRAVEEAAAGGCRLIMTADCGITAHAEALRARELGMDVIITDHHQPQDGRPEALAVVNPKQPECSYPFPHLCGVGVAFKVLQGLMRLRGAQGLADGLHEVLDLVALGTIADMVPLAGENRVLARAGLEVLSRSTRPGLRALVQSSGLSQQETLESGDVGFVLAPRLNAAGRLGDSESGIRLLLTRDPVEAATMARALETGNQERRRLDDAAEKDAIGQIPGDEESLPLAPIVLWSDRWHSGILGIVASRMAERYRRPVILVSVEGGIGRGSGRSVGDFDLVGAVSQCRDDLEAFGGHRHAIGLTVRSERIDAFRERLAAVSRPMLESLDLSPWLPVDAQADLGETTLEMTRFLSLMAPFGLGNPEPVFVASGVGLAESARVVGKDTLRMTAYQNGCTRSCVGFRLGSWAQRLNDDCRRFSLAYTPAVNRWRGAEAVELKIRDLRPDP
jgi:single-stranded-DNA-specific exonuclease